MVAPGLPHHLTVLGDVVVGYAVDRFTVPDAGKVIGVADIVAALVRLRQLPPVRPTQFPVAGAVMPDSGVANGVVGNGFAIISGQKIQPFAVTVGIGVRFCTADTANIAVGVIGVVVGSVGVDFLGQLILRIVGVAGIPRSVGGMGHLGNVTACIILIAQTEFVKAGAAISLGIVNGGDLGGLVAPVGAAGGLDLRHYGVILLILCYTFYCLTSCGTTLAVSLYAPSELTIGTVIFSPSILIQ